MPIYEYLCDGCGPFTAMRQMADYLEPCDCPDCGASAPRVVLTAPRASLMSSASRGAFEANERSRHAPRRSSSHGAGCACCGGASKTSGEGAKSFPSARPWMISH